MRLRCPAGNCPIEVPDDLIGARIRCPHCAALIVIAEKDRERSEQLQAGLPTGAADSPETSALENRIYDGLPPLSVMLAFRRQQGTPAYDEDFGRRFQMTEDDWKALAAFEKVLDASAALTTAFWIGLAALASNAFVFARIHGFLSRSTRNTSSDEMLLAAALGVAMIGGILLIRAGARRLSRIVLGELLDWLPWGLIGLAILFALFAAANIVILFADRHGDNMAPTAILGAVGNSLAFLATAVAGAHAWIALAKIRPPEIAHRLTEALKYLA